MQERSCSHLSGSGGFQSLNGAVIARQTEPEYMGRVMSLVILAFAGFGLMALPYGVLADWVGERQTLLAMGAAVLGLCALLGSALAGPERIGTESRGEGNGETFRVDKPKSP